MMQRADDIAEFLKALAHPARLEIAGILRQGEACVCHLEAQLGFRQPYISQQVTVLRKAGLVTERRDGTYIFYRLTDPRVVMLLDALAPRETRKTSRRPPKPAICSCPHCVPTTDVPG